MQNTWMNFVVYWCIFLHIIMLLVAISWFAMINEDFSLIPLIFITRQNMETLFCVFLRFRNLPKLKLIWDFLGVNILSWEPSEAQEVNEGGHGGQTRLGGTSPWPGRAPNLVWASSRRYHPSSSPNAQPDLKTPI
jgi:hypothetical protein